MLMVFTLLCPPESIASTVPVASSFPVVERCCCDVAFGGVKTGCTCMIIIACMSVRVAIRFVVAVVPPVIVTVAVALVCIRIISIPALGTDTIF